MTPAPGTRVAVLIPCLNEEVTIAGVVRDFARALPEAEIHVFDNASEDRTIEEATAAGAHVTESPRRGKGNVVRHMFDTVRADWYVLVDGDDTYPAEAARDLVATARREGAHMLVGTRLDDFSSGAFRSFHQMGNRFISGLISSIFGARLTDVLSGYRVFSREFVQTIPLTSQGFEIETELTLRSIARGFKVIESPISYGERPEGSASKLNTYRDGILIMKLAFIIFRDYKPLTFFGGAGLVLLAAGLLLGVPEITRHPEGLAGGDLLRLALSATLAGAAFLLAAIGLVLHSIRNYHAENFELLRKAIRAQEDD